jgi:hypothetical protein
MKYQIRTLAKHEDQDSNREQNGDAMFWSTCEIESPAWFVMEAAISLGPSEGQVRRWVTTSVEAIVTVRRDLSEVLWCRVFACLPEPVHMGGTNLFEEIIEAYQSSSGEQMYLLANGNTLWDESGLLFGQCPPPKKFKLIFKKTPS